MASSISPTLHLPLHVNTSGFAFDASGLDGAGIGGGGGAASVGAGAAASTTFCVDTQVLRDNLEKERYKRKHCIKQIHELQVGFCLEVFCFLFLLRIVERELIGFFLLAIRLHL